MCVCVTEQFRVMLLSEFSGVCVMNRDFVHIYV